MDDELVRFRRAYWAVVHYVDTARMRTWEARGLTLPQLRILFAVRVQPGITTNELARQLQLTTATVSGLVDKLSRAGLVERGQRLEDRRIIPLSLTTDGLAVVGEIRVGNRAHLDALAERVGDDLEEVTRALELLVAGIETLPAAEQDLRSSDAS
jgi:DNA-binding MarR family transcriptional regulator